jgi:hypothetical protein
MDPTTTKLTVSLFENVFGEPLSQPDLNRMSGAVLYFLDVALAFYFCMLLFNMCHVRSKRCEEELCLMINQPTQRIIPLIKPI